MAPVCPLHTRGAWALPRGRPALPGLEPVEEGEVRRAGVHRGGEKVRLENVQKQGKTVSGARDPQSQAGAPGASVPAGASWRPLKLQPPGVSPETPRTGRPS